MKPSVFIEGLDREEELGRLVLISYGALTAGAGLGASRHQGFGRRVITHDVLVLSGLIDSKESDACELALLRMCRHGDIERQVRARLKKKGHARIGRQVLAAVMDRECGPKLMQMHRIKNRWFYRPTERGRLQAKSWLSGCHVPAEVLGQIETGYEAHRNRLAARCRKA